MKSKIAEQSQQVLLRDVQRLTREERLNAFLEHCQLVASLRDAGNQRPAQRRSESR